jgi:hypothetical protein
VSEVNHPIKDYKISLSDYDYEAVAEVSLILNDGTTLIASLDGSWSANCCRPIYAAGCDAIKFLKAVGITVPDDTQIEFDTVDMFDEDTEPYENELGIKNVVASMSAKEFLNEDKEDLSTRTTVDTATALAKDTYPLYTQLDGKLPQDEYVQHLTIFLTLTRDAYTGGGTTGLDRNQAWTAWETYCKGAKLRKNEPGLIFRSVDNVHAYT